MTRWAIDPQLAVSLEGGGGGAGEDQDAFLAVQNKPAGRDQRQRRGSLGSEWTGG
ncbi:hypothetical protein [Streptomyces sp. NPDC001205]